MWWPGRRPQWARRDVLGVGQGVRGDDRREGVSFFVPAFPLLSPPFAFSPSLFHVAFLAVVADLRLGGTQVRTPHPDGPDPSPGRLRREHRHARRVPAVLWAIQTGYADQRHAPRSRAGVREDLWRGEGRGR